MAFHLTEHPCWHFVLHVFLQAAPSLFVGLVLKVQVSPVFVNDIGPTLLLLRVALLCLALSTDPREEVGACLVHVSEKGRSQLPFFGCGKVVYNLLPCAERDFRLFR